MGNAIDYAGLFPPAKLSMKESLDNYLRYAEGKEAWILGRFVCSAGRLDELLIELMRHDPSDYVRSMPLPIAVVGSASADREQFVLGLEQDAAIMDRFQAAAEERADIEGYEIRLPDHEHVAEYAKNLRQFDNIDVFAELPWGPAMAESLSTLAESEFCGAKARSGGLEASAFPSSADMAGFIQGCVQLDLPSKFTAGLHHPWPTKDAGIGVRMYGFLNVFAATALAVPGDLTKREIKQILDDDDRGNFRFDDEALSWRELTASLEEIEESRAILYSFGSCSIDEPLEGLQEAGLLLK